MLGRIEEAKSTLSRALQIDPASITFVVQHNAHAAAIDLAWHAGDANACGAARRRGRRLCRSVRIGLPARRGARLQRLGELRRRGRRRRGRARIRQALALGRQKRMGLEYEARLVAHLAECFARAGKYKQAWIVASEAIEVARRRTDRVAELHADVGGGTVRRGAATIAGYMVWPEVICSALVRSLASPAPRYSSRCCARQRS